MLKITTQKRSSCCGVCRKGTTLIELMIVILILGFTLLSLTKLFMDVSVLSVAPEYQSTAGMLGQELMEEIKSKRFDELQTKDGNGNWTVTPGTETGEVNSDKSTFDDIDDFDGWAETLGSPFSGYSTSVSVDYVAASDLNAPVTPDGSPGSTPEYKRIVVTVSNNAMLSNTNLTTLVGSARSRSTF